MVREGVVRVGRVGRALTVAKDCCACTAAPRVLDGEMHLSSATFPSNGALLFWLEAKEGHNSCPRALRSRQAFMRQLD